MALVLFTDCYKVTKKPLLSLSGFDKHSHYRNTSENFLLKNSLLTSPLHSL